VVITAFADKSFTFIIKTPPGDRADQEGDQARQGLVQARTLDKVGKITRAQLEEIAKTKMKDLTAADLDAAVRTIAGIGPLAWASLWRASEHGQAHQEAKRPVQGKVDSSKLYPLERCACARQGMRHRQVR
jgi:hypothetical protein